MTRIIYYIRGLISDQLLYLAMIIAPKEEQVRIARIILSTMDSNPILDSDYEKANSITSKERECTGTSVGSWIFHHTYCPVHADLDKKEQSK